MIDEKYDDEDLEYLDENDRLVALGLAEPEPVPPVTELLATDVGPAPAKRILQPPPRGYVQVRLAEVARSRGVINASGPYKGQISLAALVRGTNLAATTLQQLLRKPEEVNMVSLSTIARLCNFLRCQPGDILVYHRTQVRSVDTSLSDSYKRTSQR